MKNYFSPAIIVLLLILAFFLVYEHRVHVFGNMQYVVFAAYIGLHLLMHAGHNGYGNHKERTEHAEHKKGDSL